MELLLCRKSSCRNHRITLELHTFMHTYIHFRSEDFLSSFTKYNDGFMYIEAIFLVDDLSVPKEMASLLCIVCWLNCL